MPPTPATTSAPTDQQVLALTHAIALQESGGKSGTPNYNAVGDNGTSHGAYQWQPGNFAAAASKYGLNPNDMSPMNQDKVAYHQVKEYAAKGYTPAQIASMWNSGQPNNYVNHSGTTTINGQPIHYDTPAYVKGVQSHYQQLIGQRGIAPQAPQTPTTPTATPAAPAPKQSFLSSAYNAEKGVATGLAKSVFDTLTGAGTIAEYGLDQTAGRVINAAKGNGFVPTTVGADTQKAIDASGAFKANNTSESIGKGIGDVAQFFVPGTGEATVAADAPKLAKALNFVKNTGKTAAHDFGIGLAQTKDPGQATGIALGGAALRTVGSAASGIKGAFNVPKQIDSLEQTYNDISGATKSGVKAAVKTGAATDAKNAAGTVGNTPQRTLAEAGVIPKTNGTKLDTAEQADAFRQGITPLRASLREALGKVQQATKPLSLSDLEQSALTTARSPYNVNSGKAASLEREITTEFANLRAHYGDTVPLQVVDDIKSARWGRAPFDSTRPLLSDANYIIAKTAQKAIEATATKAGFEDVAQLNRHIGDQLEAAKFLDQINGQTIKGGKLGRYLFQGIGSTLGKTVPGKIVGALGGDAVARLLMNNSIASPAKRLVLASLEKQDPEAYTATLKWLDDQKLLQDIRPRLEAPTNGGDYINQGRPIVAGAPSSAEYVGADTRTGGYQAPQSQSAIAPATTMANTVDNMNTIAPGIPHIPESEGSSPQLRGFANTKAVQTIGALGIPAAIGLNALKDKAESAFNNMPGVPKINDPAAPPSTSTNPTSQPSAPATQKISKQDEQTLRNVLYAEISNRPQNKRELESRVIINTALNRLAENQKLGRGAQTLKDVLTQPNQYQGYNSPQYKVATSGKGDPAKLAAIDAVIKDLKAGKLTDNTNGAFYYIHNPNGSITYDDKRPLY